MAKERPKRPASGGEGGGERTIEGWRGNALELKLRPDDLDLVDNVLTLVPILRIVTAIGQEVRKRGLRYPISSPKQLQSYVGDIKLRYGDHRVDQEAVALMMPESWFPIHHEGELLSRIHLALHRCEWETARLAPPLALQQQMGGQ